MAMNENRVAFFIITGVLAFVGILWWAFENPAINPRLDEETYTIIHKWDMPNDLNEISGISWISEDKIACVQDEEGIIYIFNFDTELVEKRVNFAKSGDYEALTIVDSTAYVMESNGSLFEISNYLSPNFETKKYKTPFSGKNNMESLVADTINNRLLFTVKNNDPNSDDYKGIYAFNLETKQTETLPILKIPLNDPIFTGKDKDDDGDQYENFYPSEIGINPINGNIYILASKKQPQLLIMSNKGELLKLHQLYKKSFRQPEGLTFSKDGTIFISNEGKKGTANILEVEFEE
ncbi:SdiA-regulated domain-containing protein [Aequorivita marina]|uniref:SdiA-regulated domain-containing protein n=1 Tax=Aequorivita marina TaxID=3073654 RepID=UPI00287506A5|nr:SdiA-regulated domain-containing protein [Aequorivita sp. S2608]MDS1297508.1 SdiA-regulated domain-containing protein [Aequorivita sp. S2608]